jgi:DeoR family fructose operon transcriptional repressor
MTAEKERIAKAALAELPPEGAIIIDAGSTTERLAAVLPMDRELTVVVNAPPMAASLVQRPNLTVIMLGGRVRPRTLATVDDWNLRLLSQIHVDVAFMGTNGLTPELGFTTPDPAEAAVKRAMIASARRAVVLADHTKAGNDYFSRFAKLTDVDTLITDAGIDGELVDDLQRCGIRVVVA